MYYAIVRWYDSQINEEQSDITFWENKPTIQEARNATATKELLEGYYEENGFTMEAALAEEEISLEDWVEALYEGYASVMIEEVPEKRWDNDILA